MGKRAESIMVELEGGGQVACAIEDNGCTRRQVEQGWASVELVAPDGYRFDCGAHSLPCHGMSDLRERAAGNTVEPCPADCDCRIA